MKLRKLLASSLAALMAVSAMAVASFADAGTLPEGTAFIGFGDGSWTYGFWNKDGDGISNYTDIATTAAITSDGEYTVGIDLSKANATAGESSTDVFESVGAMGLQIASANPDLGVDVKSIKINGTEVTLLGASYTNDEDGGRRTNIYNEWASYNEADVEKNNILTKDASTATAVLVDKSAFDTWTSIEITFDVYGIGGAEEAPAETEEGTETTTSPETGVEGVVAVAGIAVLAAGVAMVARKRK